MTAKELATMFLACKIPVADTEKMIEDFGNDKIKSFAKHYNNWNGQTIDGTDIEHYLNSTK